MKNKIILDDSSFKKLEEMIKAKYPDVDDFNYNHLPEYSFNTCINIDADADVKRIIIISWHTFKYFYERDKNNFSKMTSYSLHKFKGKIYNHEEHKGNDSFVWGGVIYNIFYFLIEYCFYMDFSLPDYINDNILYKLDKNTGTMVMRHFGE